MRSILLFLCLALAANYAKADEGMWLPFLLGKKVYADMVKKGLKVSREQLYSINRPSVKDAVLLFGNGCTAELVSGEGLLFTNYHCAYSSIGGVSTKGLNYLKNGFYANSRQEEIPVDLSVRLLIKVDDVTADIEKGTAGLSGTEKDKRRGEVIGMLVAKATEGNGYEANVLPFFNGIQYLRFTYQRFTDIRLVGAPQESVGHFGGLTDNYEWPRHAGDFAVFRIYADKQNKPAGWSRENMPYKPRYHFPVSLKGVKENDYVMIFGYPGITSRYKSAQAVTFKAVTEDPAMTAMYNIRMKYLLQEIIADTLLLLKLGPAYAALSNQARFVEGEAFQLQRHGVNNYDRRDAAFNKWAADKPEYRQLLADYTALYKEWAPVFKHRIYLVDGIFSAPVTDFAGNLQLLANVLNNPASAPELRQKAMKMADEARREFLQQRNNRVVNLGIMAGVCKRFYEDIPKEQHPPGLYGKINAKYGDLKDAATYQRWAVDLLDSSIIVNDVKWKQFMASGDTSLLNQDPVFVYYGAFRNNFIAGYLAKDDQCRRRSGELDLVFLKGMMEMAPEAVRYPDANFTMRMTYGAVRPYTPRDAVVYDYKSSVSGALEKYKAGDRDFDLPASFVDLAGKKDFDRYEDVKNKQLVTCFIADTDITGGNSGSPVLNAKGELVGLAFDNNYESLDHKMMYNQKVGRTICVDIRYVLWCIDKLGGASAIVKELDIVK